MLRVLDEDQKDVRIVDTPGGKQEVAIVSEIGIYAVIMRSRRKEAVQFQKWVYGVIRTLRQASGLEGFQIFRMLDKEHQRAAMERLRQSLRKPARVDFIKANAIANKAVSTRFGYPKMLKKGEMTPAIKNTRSEEVQGLNKIEVTTKIDDIAGVLKMAQDFKGPYVLTVDGIKTIVSREQFLDFYMDVVIEELWDLKESIEEAQSTCKSL